MARFKKKRRDFPLRRRILFAALLAFGWMFVLHAGLAEELSEEGKKTLLSVAEGRQSARTLLEDEALIRFLDPLITGKTPLIDLTFECPADSSRKAPLRTNKWKTQTIAHVKKQTWGIAAAPDGALFITGDFGVARLKRKKDDSNVQFLVESFFDCDGRCTGLAFDSHGNLYVANEATREILKFNKTRKTYSSKPTTLAKLTGTPAGIAVSEDVLYIINDSDNRIDSVSLKEPTKQTAIAPILKVNDASILGLTLGKKLDDKLSISSYLFHANGLAADSSGNLYIANSLANTIDRIEGKTRYIQRVAGKYYELPEQGKPRPFPSADAKDGALAHETLINYPHGITVGNDGRIFFTQKQSGSVVMIDFDSTVKTIATKLGVVRQITESNGQIYVAAENEIVLLTQTTH